MKITKQTFSTRKPSFHVFGIGRWRSHAFVSINWEQIKTNTITKHRHLILLETCYDHMHHYSSWIGSKRERWIHYRLQQQETRARWQWSHRHRQSWSPCGDVAFRVMWTKRSWGKSWRCRNTFVTQCAIPSDSTTQLPGRVVVAFVAKMTTTRWHRRRQWWFSSTLAVVVAAAPSSRRDSNISWVKSRLLIYILCIKFKQDYRCFYINSSYKLYAVLIF